MALNQAGSRRLPRPPEISGLLNHPAEEEANVAAALKDGGGVIFPDFITPVDIEYPGGRGDLLFPLFSKLLNAGNAGSQVRILHYGDSQLEGDRITRYLRKRMQDKFGGYGPGLVSLAGPDYGSLSLEYRQSPNWSYHTPLSAGNSYSREGLGIMLGYSTFEGPNAWVKLSPAESAFNEIMAITRLRLFLISGYEDGKIRYFPEGSLPGQWRVEPGRKFQVLNHDLPSSTDIIKLEFEGSAGALFMGLSLESRSGVIVDNICHRGSAGLEFSMADSRFFSRMGSELEPDLIILQFGINVVPAVRDSFDYYRRYLVKQVKYLNEQLPGVPVLIIGVSDMGHLADGKPVPYGSCEKVSKAQEETAAETESAFFNLLEFMGGSGSFKKWLQNDPPLMRRDYAHFTYAGGAIVASGIADALIRESNKIRVKNQADE